MMYADSNMLQYTWYNRFVSYIRTLNAAEFEEVKETVADTLEISRIETVKVEKVVERKSQKRCKMRITAVVC